MVKGTSNKAKKGQNSHKKSMKKAEESISKTMSVAKVKKIHRGSLFVMQVEEMIQELEKGASNGKSKIEPLMHKLHELCESMPSSSIHFNDLATRFPELAFYNTVLSEKAGQAPTTYSKPIRMEVIGSYLLKTGVTSGKKCGRTIDISCVMSKDQFLPKDHVNYRYNDKRSAFLALLKQHLSSQGVEGLSFECMHDNVFRPCLMMKVPDSNHQLRITATPEAGTFNLSRLGADKNALRRKIEGSDELDFNTPTPYYNSTLLEDFYSQAVRDYQHGVIKKYKNLKHAILLLKRWIAQRFGPSDRNGLGFAVSLLACHLCSNGGDLSNMTDGQTQAGGGRKTSIQESTSALQIFKVTLNSIISRYNKSTSVVKEAVLEGSSTTRPAPGQPQNCLKSLKNEKIIIESCREILNELGLLGGGVKKEVEVKANTDGKSPLSKEEYIAAEVAKIDVSELSPMERAIAEQEAKEDAEISYAAYLEGFGPAGKKKSKSVQKDNSTIPLCSALSAPTDPLNLFFGEMNVFYKASSHVLLELDLEARLALKTLDEGLSSSDCIFETLFGARQDLSLQADFSISYELHSQLDFLPRFLAEDMSDDRELEVEEKPLKKKKGNDKKAKSTNTSTPKLISLLKGIKNQEVQEKVLKDGFFALESETMLDLTGESTTIGDTTPYSQVVSEKIIRILKAGLESRLIRVWSRVVDGVEGEGKKVIVGCKLQPRAIEKTVVKGPQCGSEQAADTPEARAIKAKADFFKSLWGNKPETRRFKDGSILLCTAWEQPSVGLTEEHQSKSVNAQMIDHLLTTHFGGAAKRVRVGPSGLPTSQTLTNATSTYLDQTGKQILLFFVF